MRSYFIDREQLTDFGLLPAEGTEYLVGSVLGSLSSLMQRRGFDPPLRMFPIEGIFPLELTWVLTPFPPKTRMRV